MSQSASTSAVDPFRQISEQVKLLSAHELLKNYNDFKSHGPACAVWGREIDRRVIEHDRLSAENVALKMEIGNLEINLLSFLSPSSLRIGRIGMRSARFRKTMHFSSRFQTELLHRAD